VLGFIVRVVLRFRVIVSVFDRTYVMIDVHPNLADCM